MLYKYIIKLPSIVGNNTFYFTRYVAVTLLIQSPSKILSQIVLSIIENIRRRLI